MMAVYGLFGDGAAAQLAVDGLRAAGVPRDRITVVTPYPMEAFEFFAHEARSPMWTIACGGGALGWVAAAALLWVGETSWPLNVGGLPVFAWWPNLIIMFELTMLGSIVATVATLIATAFIGSRHSLYDPAVTDGLILVGVADAIPEAPLLHRALAAAGALRVVDVT